jgi:hypothetical protein
MDPGGNCWFCSQEEADERSYERAERNGEIAERIENDDSFWSTFLDLFGVDDRARDREAQALSRVGLTRIERIRHDLAPFASALMGARGRPASGVTALPAKARTPHREAGPVAMPHGQMVRRGLKDSHHVVQDAAVRALPGYSRSRAPTVQLTGPANNPATPHGATRGVQKQPGGGTLGSEARIAYKSLRAAGLSPARARTAVEETMQYFRNLGFDRSTVTRIPGDRRKP